MDVAILAGGLGTRLKGLWDGPKCLVPVAGKPVLAHLLERVHKLRPRTGSVVLLLGHKSTEVIRSLEYVNIPNLSLGINKVEPKGTAFALRCSLPFLRAPLLVLNGDTIPLFSLDLVIDAYHRMLPGDSEVDAMLAWYKGVHAGAAMLGPSVLFDIQHTGHHDLSTYFRGAAQVAVPEGFLDIGTPDTFHAAKTFTGDLP